jgi:hypothetical protein
MIKNLFMAGPVTLMMAAAMMPAPAMADGAPQDFTIHNESGVSFTKLYVDPESHADDWGDDLLAGDPIDADETQDIKFHPENDECEYGVRVTDAEGNNYDVRHIDLCKTSKLIFKLEDGKMVFDAD